MDSHPASHVAVASTRYAYLRRAVKTWKPKTKRKLNRNDYPFSNLNPNDIPYPNYMPLCYVNGKYVITTPLAIMSLIP